MKHVRHVKVKVKYVGHVVQQGQLHLSREPRYFLKVARTYNPGHIKIKKVLCVLIVFLLFSLQLTTK